MKYAIIADIHGNLEAFQVVLEDIEKQKCTHVACLGDVVGYNANPKECLDTVRAHEHPVRQGQPRRILLQRHAAWRASAPTRPRPATGRAGI